MTDLLFSPKDARAAYAKILFASSQYVLCLTAFAAFIQLSKLKIRLIIATMHAAVSGRL